MLPVYSFFFFASLILAGCGGVSQTAPEGKSSNPIKVAIKLPPGVSMLSGGRVKSTNPRIAATTITAIKLEVTGEGIETPIIVDVPIPPSGSNVAEVVIDVPFGLARLFQVTIATSTGSVFKGSTTLDIDAGNAKLNPATSELEIPVTIDVNIDIDAPVTTASLPAGIYNATQNVTVTCADVFSNQSGCVKMFLTADGTTPRSTDSPVESTTAVGAQLTHAVNITAEGATTLKFFSIDGENNVEDVKTASYIIDTVVPNAPVITSPAVTSTSNSSSIVFAGTAEAPTPAATAVTITLKSDLDGNIGAAPVDSAGAWSVTVTLTDGAHTVTATATDEAQNTSPASTSVSVAVDTVAPLAPVINSLTTPTNINSFTISGTAEPLSTVAVFESGSAFGTTTAGSGGAWSIPSGTLADGAYSFTATATDSFNNTGPASTAVSVAVDTLAPAAPAIDPLTTPTNINSFTISGTAEANSTVTILDGTATVNTTIAGAGGIWSIPSGTLADGPHSFTATAMDSAGNTGPASTAVSVTVDTVVPSPPTIISPSSPTTDSTPVITGNAAEASLTITLTSDIDGVVGTGQTDSAGAWSITTNTLRDGVHTFTATATDSAGNVSSVSNSSSPLTIDTTGASIINITSTTADGLYSIGATIVITITFDEPVLVSGVPTLTLDTGGAGRPAVFTGGSNSATLTFSYTVQAGDNSPDLDYMGTSSLSASGGSITDLTGNPAVLTPPVPGASGSLSANKALVIDTVAPTAPGTPTDAGAFSTSPTVTFNWTASTDANGGISHYLLSVGTTPGGTDILNASNVGNVLTATATASATGSFGTAVNFTIGNSPVSVAISDFNGDGISDLALANAGSKNVSILLGDGLGDFGTAVNFAVGGSPASVATSDFNGDGFADLVVAHPNLNNVSILLGDGLGGFGTAVNFAVGSSPRSNVAISDFNGDGFSDITVANWSGASVSVLLGKGDGTFAPAVNVAVGFSPLFVATSDFNGDGFSDIAVANSNSDNVSILLGIGNGTFVPAVNFAVGSIPKSVAVGDFNGDGKSDLAVANWGSANVSVLLGDGLGGFGTAVNFAVGSSTGSNVAISDFNGDGNSDLAIAGSGKVSILLGNGLGTFGPTVNFAVGTQPAFVAISDFNGDGISDLAVANQASANVSVLLGDGADGQTLYATVTAVDNAGNSSSASGNSDGIKIDLTPPPAPTITSPMDGAVMNNQTVTISGTAEPGADIIIQNAIAKSATPLQVNGLTGITAIASGGDHTLVLKSDGTVWSWGGNFNGQLGDGTTTERSTPVQVSGLTGVTAISAGSYHSLALKNDGTVWAWGGNIFGQLGDGTTTDSSTPVQVSNLTGAKAVSAGINHSLALMSDGTVRAWGGNFSGELGDGTTTNSSTPVQVSGLPGVATITVAGGSHSLAVLNDGTVWAWGDNFFGELGDGTTTNSSAPVLVSGLSGTATAVGGGGAHSIVLLSDGTVWGWGANFEGQLGIGDVQVGTAIADSTTGAWTITTGALAEGAYTFIATASDIAGNTGASSFPVFITIDTTPPSAATVTAPSAGFTTADTTPIISGTAEPFSAVVVTESTTTLGSTTADFSGNWSVVTSALPSGSHTVTITVTDPAGNVGATTASVTFTIDTSAAFRILGKWGYGLIDHFNSGGWGVEGGTTTLNSDGTGSESFTMKDGTGSVTTVTDTFTYTATDNSDGSITLVQTFPDTTTDTTVLALSDDNSMMIEDSTTDPSRQGLSIAVKMPSAPISTTPSAGSFYTIGYEHDAAPTPKLYRSRAGVNTTDSAGAVTFIEKANENGTFIPATGNSSGSTTYSINADGTFTAGAGFPEPVTGHLGANGLITINTTANPLGTATPPWWSMDFNMKQGDKTYSTADLAGTWAFVGFGDDGGTTFNSDFGTLTCDAAGSCTVSGRENMNGSFNAMINETTNGPFTVAPDGSFGASLHGGASSSPTFAAAIGNGGNTIIINESFDDSVAANKTNRFLVVAVKCTACSGLGENTGFPIAATSNPEGGVDAAFDGTNWLVGVQGKDLFSPFGQGQIAGQMIDSFGALVGGLIQMTRTGGAPHVAFDGTNYLMVWSDDASQATTTPPTDTIYGQFVDTAGALVGSPFPIAPGSQLSGPGNEGLGGIAFGGGKYLVVYYKEVNPATRDSKVFGRIIDPANTTSPVGAEIAISSGFGDFGIHSVAFNGADFLVVWDRDDTDTDVMGRLVSTAGVPQGTSEFVISANLFKNDNPLSVACDSAGGLCAVAWIEQYDAVNDKWDVFVRMVDTNGPIGSEPNVAAGTGNKFFPSVAWDGTKFLLTWSDMTNDANRNFVCDAGESTCWDMYGQYLDATGAKVGNPFVISDDPGNQIGGAGFGGGQFLVLINNGTGVSQTAPSDDLFGLFISSKNVSGFTQPSISAGAQHTLALKDDGTVWAWGLNNAGQLGDGTTTNSSTPVQVSGLAGVTAIVAGNSHNLALLSDGTVWAWGDNSSGQLGNGTTSTTATSTPVQVSGLTGITAIAGGGLHSLALKSDGTVWAWGWNGDGQLGATTTESCGVVPCSSIPVQVSGLTGVIAVAAGSAHSLALKSDGTVWAWGNNIRGQLGDGSQAQKNAPVQVSGLMGVTAIAGGGVHSLALLSDGTVWAWGSNFNGQLGNGTSGNISSTPVQVSGLMGVTAIAAAIATDHSFALLSDGTVWAWGNNLSGQLGDGTTIQRLTPVQVSSLTGVTATTAGDLHGSALLTDGTISSWGGNGNGQLGNGATTNSTTPVQVVDISSAPFNIGVQPTKITSAVSGAESITVNWSANLLADSYNLYWDTSPGVTTANGTLISGITGTSFTHTGLSAENDYYYVVTAVSGSAESPISNEIRAGPQTAAPTGVVGDPENKQNRIAWNALPGADSFKIYWNTTGGVTASDSSFTSSVAHALHSGLANGTAYYYRVAGVNPAGVGALSTEISVIPTTVGALLGHSDASGVALANAVMDAGGENDTNPLALDSPHEIAIDPDGLRIFVADPNNNRVLAFPLDSNFNIASRKAVSVLGQPDFSHNDADQGRTSAGADTLDGVRGVAYFNDGTKKWLLVADRKNHRVLIYDITSGVTDGMAAMRVLGQADFTSQNYNVTNTSSSTTADSMREPARVIVAKVGTATLVIVSDRFNDRVLIWDITTAGMAGLVNGQPADYVIGQYSTAATGCAPDVTGVTSATSGCTPDFTTGGSNNNGRGVGDGSLNDPTGLVMWGNNLVVADSNNDRVMVFDLGVNAANLSTTQALFATFELGQTDFTGVSSSSGLGRLGGPESMAVQGNLLFVADEFNNRVYVFDLSAPSNGMNPVYVYGQTSLSGSVANTAQNGLNRPEGLAIAGNSLFVSEVINDRLVQYDITNIAADISGSAFGPNAVDLLGQTDWRPGMTDGTETVFWDTGGGNDTGAVGFQKPKDAATGTINGVNYIFVTDFYNDRLLVFEADRFFNPKDLQADFVIGEPDFDHDSGGVTQSGLNSPHGVAFDDSPTGLTSKFLFVSDRDHNRVMVFDLSGGITNGMAATAVLGQTSFTSSLINGTGSTTPALNGLYNPRRMNIATVGGTKYLFVSEKLNARVSIFNISDGVTTGENASFFLGNSSGTTKSTAISKSIMTTPYSAEYDSVGQRLFVVDRSANRVLVYDLSAGITTGMAAVHVIGQSDFVTQTAGTSPSKFNLPQDVAYDSANQQLFVSDFTGNRVLVFDLSGGITDGMSASGVIGQPDFTTSAGHMGTSRASLTMNGPSGVWYEPHYGRLLITESSDNRMLVLNPTSGQFTASPIPNFASYATASKEITLSWGAVTGAVSYNVYRGTAPGVTSTHGTQVISGSTATTFTDTALTPGTYYYVVTVVDSSGIESPISNQVRALAQASSGDLDLSFATVGHATLDITGFKDKGRVVAIDSQDRIVVAGTSGTPGIRDFAIARYFEDGTLDSSFGASGAVTTDISGAGSDDHIRGLTIDSAGRIVAVGWADTGGGALDMAIVRYNGNGTLDTTFGTGGIVTIDSGGIDDRARAVAIDSSGKILVAGQFADATTSDFAVVRLNGNGSLDTTFNSTGTVPGTATHDFGGTIDKARGLAIDSAGRILVAGDFESSPGSGALEFGLIRLLSDGALDTTAFGISGENSAFIGNGKASGALAIDANGNIVLAGEKASAVNPADQDFILVRFNSTGQLDSTFGSGGTVITDINGATDWAEKVLIDANQKIIVLGYVTADDIGNNGDFAVVRYNSDGTLDTNFAGSGKVTSHLGMNQVIFGGTIDADNRIVIAGASGTGTNRFFEVARYWNNSFPYTGPSTISRLTQPSIAGGEFHTLALKDDGTVWAWGLNVDGQLGDGTKIDSSTPVQVTGLPANATVTAVSGGASHSLALLSDGTLWAWGFNFNGELGDGTFTDSSTPVQVTGLPAGATVMAISAGGHHNLALLSDGTVWTWGFNTSGQLGDGTTTGSNVPVQVTDPADASGFLQGVTAIAAGGEHSLVLKSDGTVWAWGSNFGSALGNGATTNSSAPVQVTGFPTGATVVAISAGGHHNLALLSDGTIRAWGNNFSGELGDGTTIDSSAPVPVTGLTGVTGVAAGRDHSIALLSDGTVRAWGFNSSGQLGDGTTIDSSAPVQVTGLTGVTDIAGGGIHSIALLSDGTISAWGVNSSGQLGDGTMTQRLTPVQVVDTSSAPFGLSSMSATAVGGAITLKWNAITGAVSYNVYRGTARGVSKANGTLISSGSSATTFTDIFITPGIKYHYVVTAVDSSGVEGPISSQVGARVAPTSAFTHTAVAGGEQHTLALKDDGTVWAWGANWDGQLGNGATTDSSRPVQVSGLTGVTAIATGKWHSLALKSDGTVWAWGANWNGQLGATTSATCGAFMDPCSTTPVQVSGLTGVTAIAAGGGHSLALKSDGTLWAWGANWVGQLGNGTFNSGSTPVQVSTGSATVTAIAAGYDHSLALFSNGTVWAWGDNWNGQLGNGTTTNSFTPVQVSKLFGVTAIAAGDSHNLALLSDGTVWAWGANWDGQLGDGMTTQRSTPVQVSGLTGVIAVSAGTVHSVALKNDGTVWAWGANWDGQLGDGTFSNSLTPVQATGFPTDTAVSAISAGGFHNIVRKSDGTILAWGANFDGQLGDGTTNENTMPVPVIDSASVPFNLVANILTVDTVPPSSPSVVINSGAATTGSAVVTLGLSATDSKGVVGYFVSESSVTPAVSRFIRAPSAVSFSATTSFPLSAGDGLKTVNAWFIDVAGRISSMASASITLNTASATSADCMAAVNSIQGVEKVDQSLIPGMVVAAKNTCTAAANALSGVTSNDADTARFFSALSRIAANGFDFTSDNNRANGLNTTGEVLEAFGCDSPGFMNGDISCSVLGTWKDWTGGTTVLKADGTYTSTFSGSTFSGTYAVSGDVITLDASSFRFEATTSQLLLFDVNTGSLQMGHDRVISSTAPTGAELQARDDLFKTELAGAVADLTAVSQSFNVVWWAGSGGTGTESDYGDVLTVRGLAKAMLGWIDVENSYDLNTDIGALANATTPPTTQQFLIDHPNFLTLSSTATARLTAAQTDVSGASDDLSAAINWILAETDAQSDDFINLVNTTMAEINQMQTDLANIKAGLTSPTVFADQFGAQKGVLDMKNFFAGTSLRSLLPAYTGDTPGLFPDPTFNGIWTGFTSGSAYDVNSDVVDKFGLPVSDGIPDILQSGSFGLSAGFTTQPSIDAESTHTLALKEDGTVWEWGHIMFTQTSLGDVLNPVQKAGLAGVVEVADGTDFSLALKSDGTVWAWGSGTSAGQLGNGGTSASFTPVRVGSLTGIVDISAGNKFGLALRLDGTVWAWGNNGWGQLGNGAISTTNTSPVQVCAAGQTAPCTAFLNNVVAVSAGKQTSLALKSDGTVWIWGQDGGSSLKIPVQVATLSNIVDIASGGGHNLALRNDGTVWAWGTGSSGQLGNGVNTAVATPVQVCAAGQTAPCSAFLSNVVAIAAGDNYSLALLSDGTVMVWGGNTNGKLGDGTINTRDIPVPVTGLTGVTDIAATASIVSGHTVALLVDGTVKTWGTNSSGELGNGTIINSATPVQAVDTSSTPFNIGLNIPVTTARATATAVGEITVTWNAAPLAASYNIYRGAAPGVTTTNGMPVGSGITGTSFIDTGLTSGTTYYYIVTVVDSAGAEGPASIAVSATLTYSSGLIAYYPFNGNANDASGYGNNATIIGGATFVAGQNDQAIYINNPQGAAAITQYVALPNSASITSLNLSSFTVNICYKTTDSAQLNGRLFGNAGDSITDGIIMDYNATGRSFASSAVRSGGVLTSVALTASATSAVVTDGAIHCEALIVDRTNGLLQQYVDAQLIDSVSIAGIGAIPMSGLVLGATIANDNFGARLTTVDDLRIYNRALSTAEVAALAGVTVRKVPDTGQTTKYSTAFGDDSDYVINPPSYTDNGDGTITDNVTSLMWQKQDDGSTYNWYEASGTADATYNPGSATNVCGALTTGGYSDWRLPDEFELMGIVNYEIFSPAIAATYFPATVSSWYWSATTYASSTSHAVDVYFANGNVGHNIKSLNSSVRCVRGTASSPHSFTDNGDGTVTDNVTTLMWQKQDDNIPKTWESAITYCETLSLAGHADWRLPNIKELRSIVDDTAFNPAISSTYFPAVVSSYYWSATTDAFNSSNAWFVDIDNGNVGTVIKSNSSYLSYNNYARCVRSASPPAMLSETFESGVLPGTITVSTVGGFNSSPGIKNITNLGSTKAFGFGRSTCGASCFSANSTSLTITFPSARFVTGISFKNMELFGDWGSVGAVFVNNVNIGVFTPTTNTNVADTTFRNYTLSINQTVTSIEIRVWDITTSSEMFIDDLVVY